VLTYKGVNALSDFRKKNLLSRLRKIDKSISGVSAEYVHFVKSDPLNKEQKRELQTILTYGEKYSAVEKGELFLVVPRFGTISPWSSKATDIIHNCGLAQVKRAERGIAYYISSPKKVKRIGVAQLLHDKMVETVLSSLGEAEELFARANPAPFEEVNLVQKGKKALYEANDKWGLALSDSEINYLYKSYKTLDRDPTDVELMMFGAVNSEHCRHKIFNADWIIDGRKQPKSLFKMIKNTYEKNSSGILSAYSDNAAVLKGPMSTVFLADQESGEYAYRKESVHIVAKVETHNHPTAIAPFPGAATGSGGEIRDEGATGRGAKPKIGLSGFSVSNLCIPGSVQPWEKNYGRPNRLSSPLDIMIEGPIGAAAFNNEFGRPNLAGYFRTYEQEVGSEVWGYHKPIMVAGGLGNIRARYVHKKQLPSGAQLIVLGGPAMKIGLGGGSASSMQTGESDEGLDFASVQRANAEIQRRAQEVITSCWSLDKNPILSIHDIGAGGLSNGLPELVHDSGLGAEIELRKIPNDEPGMSPMEIWCNEAQERYVLAVKEKDLGKFIEICERERCPFAVVGHTTKKQRLILKDSYFSNTPIDLPMDILFGKPPKMTRQVSRKNSKTRRLDKSPIEIDEAVKRILRLPAVASKKFLITIGDRTVGGLCVRDQMVGPWQVPVSDVAVSASSFDDDKGEAMAMGERTPLALINAPASARMAIGEAITNISAASIKKIQNIKLSANWMAATGYASEDEKLYDTVKAVGEEFCPRLGITIPVGKDSLSMRTKWHENGSEKSVTSPLSLIISAFAPVDDVYKTLTPQLKKDTNTDLILIDLGQGKNRLGGSALSQVYNQVGNEAPDADPVLLKKFFALIQRFKKEGLLIAYHDRSDGGLFTALVEMAFAGRCGIDINLKTIPGGLLEKLFNEELGAVIQVDSSKTSNIIKALGEKSLDAYVVGNVSKSQNIVIKNGSNVAYENTRAQLEKWWSETSYLIQELRDNPESATQELAAIADNKDPGLSPHLTYSINATAKIYESKPRIAIFREEGVNGHIEMAAAFDRAGFTSVDVHLNDLMSNKVNLDDFVGLVACGGFSYGDVLGAGAGWAKSILFNKQLRTTFKKFFERKNTFSLGVCNGCQMLANLKELIPGAENWPQFLKNTSEQFEARLVSVKINESPSIFFKGMLGSVIPVPVAHGEGRVGFVSRKDMDGVLRKNLVSMQFVSNYGEQSGRYPFNPNGSELGITALTTPDGRATILMPHPERAFLAKQLSWRPDDWQQDGPWMKMFQNAREWVS
jgi:phosphoribosylformylglycinamidine synthase